MEMTWGIVSLLLLSSFVIGSRADGEGDVVTPVAVGVEWKDMNESCVEMLQDQVAVELGASITYLSMAAHFARDCVNRPGFSKLFFESASEERQHAIKIIDYLLMRGYSYPMSKFQTLRAENIWEMSGVQALRNALAKEAEVTKSIRKIIAFCEGDEEKQQSTNHFHLVDYLAGDFLDEQYKGQREIAGRLVTLKKMEAENGPLAEFLFDRKLLKGELE